MKYAAERPYADPEKAARKLVEIANSVEAVQDGRIFIELVNAPSASRGLWRLALRASAGIGVMRALNRHVVQGVHGPQEPHGASGS
jgi:hypothetical protein